ncbi:MAG: hypothetical protein WBP64_13070 [Nitrososphaeraceae archaeon]
MSEPQSAKAGITPFSTGKVCQAASGGIIKISSIRTKETLGTLSCDTLIRSTFGHICIAARA